MPLSSEQRVNLQTRQYSDGELDVRVWQPKAACVDMDTEEFFPEKGGSAREARKKCLGCEVTRQCLEYALMTNTDFGVWGGLTPPDRRAVRKLRKLKQGSD